MFKPNINQKEVPKNMGNDIISDQATNEEYLEHHGILGMKWGVRRTKRQLSNRGSTQPTKSPNKYYEKVRVKRIKKKNAKGELKAQKKEALKSAAKTKNKNKKEKDPMKQMSDEELQNVVKRIQLEQRYKQLTAPKTSKGKAMVTTAIEKAAQEITQEYTAKYMKQQAAKLAEFLEKKAE